MKTTKQRNDSRKVGRSEGRKVNGNSGRRQRRSANGAPHGGRSRGRTLITALLSRRAGLTLTEALFAAGILTIGVLGIMSLVPAATHQIASATGSTLGANIAREAFDALQNGQLAMADYAHDDYPAAFQYADDYLNGVTGLDLDADTAMLNTYGSWSAAIAAIDDAWEVAPDTLAFGCGAPPATSPWGAYTHDSFRIPGDSVLTTTAWTSLLTGTPMAGQRPEFVPVPWAEDYGWTATFLPVWTDENTPGIPDGTITPSTSYRVQVAVWRWHKWNFIAQGDRDGMYDIKGGAGISQGTFTAGSTQVDFATPIHNAHNSGFIRPDAYGVWLQVDRIGEDDGSFDKHSSAPRLHLVAPFAHPGMADGDTMTVNVSMASPLRLVGLYDGYITPPSMRATP
jgi:hypothetical protein